MTAEEFHQQQLEEQQLSEGLYLKAAMARNHGKFIGVAKFIRDNPEELYVKVSLKYLLAALEEHENLVKEEKKYATSRLA